MAVQGFSIVLLIVLLSISGGECKNKGHRNIAPAPAVDCTSVMMSMADCLSFVTIGSTVQTPEPSCCSNLKTVLDTHASCLCEAFKSSASLGVSLNVTKANSLPAACKLQAPPAANCGQSAAPSSAPTTAPTHAPASSPHAHAPKSHKRNMAPAPAPQAAASSVVSISTMSLVVALVVASFSCL